MKTQFRQVCTTALLCASVVIASIPAQAAGDATAGQSIFRKCSGCHKIGDGAKNATGPVLQGVIGRQAGTFPDFPYGDGMIAAGKAGLVWNKENLAEYIADPRAFLRGFLNDDHARAKMPFKLRDEQQRMDVAAYLATLQ